MINDQCTQGSLTLANPVTREKCQSHTVGTPRHRGCQSRVRLEGPQLGHRPRERGVKDSEFRRRHDQLSAARLLRRRCRAVPDVRTRLREFSPQTRQRVAGGLFLIDRGKRTGEPDQRFLGMRPFVGAVIGVIERDGSLCVLPLTR